MGDRYFLELNHCGRDHEVVYAPTSGFLYWTCPICRTQIDLEEYTGINAESTANTDAGIAGIKQFRADMAKR